MPHDAHDAIVATASAPGQAARGIIRLTGPSIVAALDRCFIPAIPPKASRGAPGAPQRLPGAIPIDATPTEPALLIPGHLYLWPTDRSYTRQPAAEFHTIGSPPLLAAIVEQLGRAGVRIAEPGEFTLRAFLAGRIDLVQAEAVLGVIDARGRADLDAALDQLAGGLSRPLDQLRERLLGILADLEAGLDFVEEDIEFIGRDDLSRHLEAAHREVVALIAQLRAREAPPAVPRVALVGLPNAGKSSLFNALVERYGQRQATALVSPEPGVTRDWLIARLVVDGVEFDLIDTAGEDAAPGDEIHHAAQRGADEARRRADVRLHCIDSNPPPSKGGARGGIPEIQFPTRFHSTELVSELLIITKIDESPAAAFPPNAYPCSAKSGAGIPAAACGLATRLQQLNPEANAAASASARTLETLAAAEESLNAAHSLASAAATIDAPHAGEDLIAAELRLALAALAQVTGAATTDDLLDRIFSKFCIGK
jgi:tRNA modification GTPase